MTNVRAMVGSKLRVALVALIAVGVGGSLASAGAMTRPRGLPRTHRYGSWSPTTTVSARPASTGW